jgi:thiamine biosynthesis lipoprotein
VREGGGAARARRWLAGGGALSAAAGLALVLLPVVAGPALSARAGTPVRVERSAPRMGTVARVVVYAPDRDAGDAAADAALARIAELDARLSDYRDDSEVARLSRQPAGVPFAASRELFDILAASASLAGRTGGAFDVTAGRLTHLWRRARRLNAWPDAAQVDAARAAGGYRTMRLDVERRTVTLDRAGIIIDAGGIAKGYAADEALAVLRARGLPSALVALGGDVVAGDPPPGEPAWRVAIPRLGAGGAPAGDAFRIPLVRAAVSTSGDAEQWMTAGGVRRSHVIDPRTGWPLTGRTSTSVVAARGVDADALSTTLGIVDRDAGEALLRDARPGPAHGLWQRLDDDGTLELHRTTDWPVPPRS